MQVNNQKPAVLSPVYKSKNKGDFEPQESLRETLVEPLFVPAVAGQSVSITANNKPLTQSDITQYIIDCCGDNINPTAETAVKSLFQKTLVYFDEKTNLGIQDLFSIQSAVRENQTSNSKQPVLPFPSNATLYTPAIDVIPSSRQFLAGQCSYDVFFVSLAFYARPNTLGFYFANNVAFDNFKNWLNTQIQTVSSVLPTDTNNLFSDFQKLNLNQLTESLLLRNNDDDNNHEYSFARMIISYLMNYTTQVSSGEFGVLPFTVGELFCPKSIVFVNVDAHSKATPKQVTDEWNIINKSLSMKVKMISNNKLSKLTAVTRNLQKITSSKAATINNQISQTQRAARIRFRKTAPTTVDIVKILKKIIKKMAFVSRSTNVYKLTKMTYAKPNRRNPDDFNKQGKIVSTKYKPDIHVYIDTSGSISERNYQDATKACISMAKKLNVDIYFNSFSNVMSQCTKLRTKDKSTKQIYAQFQKVPKVTGGTDYEQIWHYINNNPKRRRELSIIITDFEWYPPNRYVKHPDNLYYIPCSHTDWKWLTRNAKDFCTGMMRIEPNIRTHVLL